MGRDQKTLLRKFHQARWDEQIIFEMSVPGERGILVPRGRGKHSSREVGDGVSALPASLRRKAPAALPEVNQMRVLRHYLRLSQETMGTDVTIDISQGTCTMKYSPKVQEHMAARHPGMTEIHPLQDDDTIQGILEMYYKFEQFLQGNLRHGLFLASSPAAGPTASSPTPRSCGPTTRRAATASGPRSSPRCSPTPATPLRPATAGYKVITLMPDENGYPDLEAMKAALSDRTAGIFITNPEDTGIYNPRIEEYVKAAHDVGGLVLLRPGQRQRHAGHRPGPRSRI